MSNKYYKINNLLIKSSKKCVFASVSNDGEIVEYKKNDKRPCAVTLYPAKTKEEHKSYQQKENQQKEAQQTAMDSYFYSCGCGATVASAGDWCPSCQTECGID